ncbi:MAG: methyltransferase domain-containing protein [Rhodospirillaceae bacterium]|nr:methyltransferase domain-containing protein [Rhodospirillaceae bacterium]MBT7953915.1 methyltransferase domain-containing protein [Rhodospirillaceae bacterium]
MDFNKVYLIFQNYFRPKRMRQFVELFNLKDSDSILDVGGGILNWNYISIRPKITIGNINIEDRDEERFSFRNIDGTNLPYKDDSFDIAFSNSVIEHVGDWDKQEQFAVEIQRVAKNYYVQTPNKWFPIEPHFVSPLIHLLPRNIFRKLLPFLSLWYWVNRPSKQHVDKIFSQTKLLSESQMRELFPDAKIIREKFLFFSKSIIAVRIITNKYD